MRYSIAIALACAACRAGPLLLVPGFDTGCDEECTARRDDQDRIDEQSAVELGKLAIASASAGDCACAYALFEACSLKDAAIRSGVLADAAMRACVSEVPDATRNELRAASAVPGTIARCATRYDRRSR